MNCSELKSMMWLHICGELEPKISQEVQSHLSSCQICQKEYAAYEIVVSEIKMKPSLPDSYWDNYTEQVIERLKPLPAVPRVIFWRFAAVLGLIAVLIGGIISYRTEQNRKMNEIITNLDTFQNLEILERKDFNGLVKKV